MPASVNNIGLTHKWPPVEQQWPPAVWLEQSGWKVLDRCCLFALLIGEAGEYLFEKQLNEHTDSVAG